MQISRDQAKGVEAEIQALEAANSKLTKTLDDQRKAASSRPLNASSAVETGGTSAQIGENQRKIEELKQQLQDLDNLSSGYEVNIARLQSSLRDAALESSRTGDEIEEATQQAGRSLDTFLNRSAPSETPYDKALQSLKDQLAEVEFLTERLAQTSANGPLPAYELSTEQTAAENELNGIREAVRQLNAENAELIENGQAVALTLAQGIALYRQTSTATTDEASRVQELASEYSRLADEVSRAELAKKVQERLSAQLPKIQTGDLFGEVTERTSAEIAQGLEEAFKQTEEPAVQLADITSQAFSAVWQSVFEGGEDIFEALGSVLKRNLFSAIDAFLRRWAEAKLAGKSVDIASSGTSSGGGIFGALKGAFGGGGAFSAALATVGVAAAVYVIAKHFVDRKKSKRVSEPVTIGFDSEQGFSGQALLFGDLNDQAREIYETLRTTFQDLLIEMGAVANSIPEIGLRVRRDGKEWILQMGETVLGTFATLDEAMERGILSALQQADWREIGENVAALIRQGSLEALQENLSLARDLDLAEHDEPVRELIKQIDQIIGEYRRAADAARQYGLDLQALNKLLLEELGNIGNDLRRQLGQHLGGGTEGLDFLELERKILAYNEALLKQGETIEDVTERQAPGPGGGGGGNSRIFFAPLLR